MLWVPGDVDGSSIAAGAQVVTNLVATVAADILVGAIVKRVVGWWHARNEVSDVPSNCMSALYTQRAESFGGGIRPELEVDPWQFMWRDNIVQFQGDFTGNPNQVLMHQIDVKVNRKFRSADDVILVLQTSNLGASAVTSGFNVRTLVWIP